MKFIISENKFNNIIEKYILDTYPMVKNVKIVTRRVMLGGGVNSRGESIIDKRVVVIEYDHEKLEWSPNKTLREISTNLNSVFGLDMGLFGSDWDIEYN
jgi:hypothetical protein